MCGLTEYCDQPIFAPSLFVTIRKRITIDDINAMTLDVMRKAQQNKKNDDSDKDGVNDDTPDESIWWRRSTASV